MSRSDCRDEIPIAAESDKIAFYISRKETCGNGLLREVKALAERERLEEEARHGSGHLEIQQEARRRVFEAPCGAAVTYRVPSPSDVPALRYLSVRLSRASPEPLRVLAIG